MNGNQLWNKILEEFPEQFLSVYFHNGSLSPVAWGIWIEILLFFLLIFGFKFFRNSGIMVFFDAIYEKVYEFFEDIVGKEEKRWIKIYVTCMFFIILFSNLLGVCLEILSPMFWVDEAGKEFLLSEVIKIPTGNLSFNVAMALVWVIIVIVEQFKFLGFGKALYEYFPVLWKNYIPLERGNKPMYLYAPIFVFVKIFDICISVFLGILEIVGHLAKIISLAFRLFGNVNSGGMLLVMLVVWMNGLSHNLLSFDFPILAPNIIYLQELLVSLIQALVFPLLVGIFIKVAKTH